MNILEFSYHNFRNLQDERFLPEKGVNIIYGENAQGKTNLLEAMWLFTGGRSFRGAKDLELVRIQAEEKKFSLHLRFYAGNREQNAQLTLDGGKRSSVLNGVSRKGSACFVGNFCAVIFSPEHLSLVKGGPALRRSFLDCALCQIKPAYSHLLYRYQHTLQQRNSLLKDIPRHSELLDTIEIWDEKLASYGSTIMRERLAYAKRLSLSAQEIYKGISGGREQIELSYLSSFQNAACTEKDLKAAMTEMLRQRRREDLSCGYTLTGPHRDDLDILIDHVSARAFGSQGQQRSIVLSLKFAEAALLSDSLNEPPVLFLDDVMSELDTMRQEFLFHQLGKYQVFITCCEPENFKFLNDGAVFEMAHGALSRRRETNVSAFRTGYGSPDG